MLEDEAEDWWNGSQGEIRRKEETVTWELFVSMFYERYFSAAVWERKEQEFLDLSEGDMAVDAYEAKFNALSRFASHMVGDEE